MLKKKIIPVFLASVLTVSGTTGFVTEAFSENVYAAEEVHTERLWMVQFRRIMQMISLIIMTMAWERTRVVYCF